MGMTLEFDGSAREYFSIYFVSGLIILAAVILVGILFGVLTCVFDWKRIHPIASVMPMYGRYIVAYAYLKALSGNLSWNNIRLGPLTFYSTMLSWDLIKLYFINALGIFLSLGLLIPWAVIRTYKYRVNHMQVMRMFVTIFCIFMAILSVKLKSPVSVALEWCDFIGPFFMTIQFA